MGGGAAVLGGAATSCAILSTLLIDSAGAAPGLRASTAFAPAPGLRAGSALVGRGSSAAVCRPNAVSGLSMQGNGGSGIDWTGSGNSKGFDIIGGNAGKKSGANSSPGFQDSGLGFEIPVGAKVEKKGTELNPKTDGDPELVLAELAFSNPMEMPKIIERNLPYLDDTFFNFVDNKIKNSPDKDEVETLTLLKEAVIDLKKQITGAIAKLEKEKAAQAMAAGQAAKEGDVDLLSFDDEDLALATFDALIDDVMKDMSNLAASVEAAYDKFDLRFLERLGDRIAAATGEDKDKLNALNAQIQQTMSSRVQRASSSLQTILKAGNPDQMKEQLAVLNAKGGLDDALILLIEANIEMAKKADAGPAIQVLSSLREAAIDYKDESMPAEIRLIRKLLRTDDKDARRQLFVEAFTPKDKMYNEDGMELPNQGVDGRRFVQALRGLIQDFGNVDKKFLDQVNTLAKESELAARDIFGLQEKDISTLQQEAFDQRSVSVWDLEQLEEAYVESGQKAPWQFPSKAGWDENGNMVIGGDSFKKNQGDDDSKVIW